jgi:hypothetical protein
MTAKSYVEKRTEAVDALLRNREWLILCVEAKAAENVQAANQNRRQARKYLQGRGKAWRFQAERKRSR